MNIMLIDPPFYRFMGYYNRYFPLGLAYMAAVLRNEGHKVLIYDSDANINPSKMDFSHLEQSYPLYLQSLKDDRHHLWQEMKGDIHNFKPDVIGISVWTSFAASAFKIASLCKGYDHSIPIVMGGPHISLKHEEVIKICPDVDYLITGEGETTFSELLKILQNIKTYENSDDPFKDIKGLSYKLNGVAVHNPHREFISDLDSLPFPAYDLLFNKDCYTAEDMGLIMSSRGCPYGCSYCATEIWKRKVRYHSVDYIVEAIHRVIKEFGTKQFSFKDDSLTANKKRVLALCDKLIKENIAINWDCNTRVDLVDEELLRKMKAAGCNSIKVGIETGSEKVLKLVNKKTTLAQARDAAKLFKKVGIHWTGYFMIGIPSETREEIYQTLNFMREIKPDFASLSVYGPFPGTDLFKIGIESGLIQNEMTMEDFFNMSPKHYYMKDITRRVDTMDGAAFESLELEMRKAFNEYNKSFIRLAKRAMARRKIYFEEPQVLLGDIIRFWSWMKN